ncbi:MAG: tetratricopeptide repeat protein [Pseudomonadota bacterium]
MLKRFLQILSVALLFGLLSACDSAEERAEKHFQKGVALYDAGDTARAVIELRNVFKLDGAHLEARMLMARIEEDRDNPAAAYGQFLAAAENHPAHFPAQYGAARLAGDLGDWEAADRHVEAAKLLDAEAGADPVLQAVDLGVAYQRARRNQELTTAWQIAGQAADLLETEPDIMLARRIVIDDRLLRQDWEAALTELDGAIARAPDERAYYGLRLSVLDRLGRPEAIEAQLRDMIDRFPGDETLHRTLVQWYVTQQRTDDAEAYLRDRISTGDREADARLMLIDFLIQLRGPEPTLTEIDSILATIADDDVNRSLYRAARASLIFERGDQEAAIVEMQSIIEENGPSDQTRRIKLTLAKMLEQIDNPVGARALVEEVLQEDATNVEALKMRAARLIEGDQTEEALVELRRALDQAPRDAGLFTLMAQAQERAGSRDLMGEMLAMAVEASGSAPEETLRYADFLVQDDRLLVAESVLVGALRLRSGQLQLLNTLGDVYIRLEDWQRAEGVIAALTRDGSPSATAVADTLKVRMLAARNKQQELRALLEQLAAVPEGNNQAVVAAIRLRLAEGDLQGALAFLESSLAATPDDPDLRLISAGLLTLDGKPDEARDVLRTLLQEYPQNDRLWLALYNLHRRQDDPDQAGAVLSEGLGTMPESATLNWVLASDLERQGDIAGAIDIYEKLYAKNSNSALIANNLASLLSSFREEEESLQRAYTIARRLRGTEVPQFQDTYGWIAARLGNHQEALDHLEPAAAALPDDPIVRYHLARTYDMAGRAAQALEAYRTALDLIESSGRSLPFRDEITREIARLETAESTTSD